MIENNSKYFIGVLGAVLGWILAYYCFTNKIPNVNKVQSDYAIPSKLEIKLEDNDGNGEKETILRYNRTNYLLKINEEGTPYILPYDIKPIEVIQK